MAKRSAKTKSTCCGCHQDDRWFNPGQAITSSLPVKRGIRRRPTSRPAFDEDQGFSLVNKA